LSNFLLWQASYAEFYFPEVLWPDFDEEAFDRALEVYAERDRRYGLVIEE
jgi:undecaprenyl diphosphate synthase